MKVPYVTGFWGWIRYVLASLIALPFLIVGVLCIGIYMLIEWTIKQIDGLFNLLDGWVRG